MASTRKNGETRRLTMKDWVAESGVPERTLRRWMRLGILPGPLGASRASFYEPMHVVRARAIEALRGQRLSLRAIRDHLAKASASELATLAGVTAPNVTEAHAPVSYPRLPWDVVAVAPGLYLLVSTERESARRLADAIYAQHGANEVLPSSHPKG